MAIPDDFTIPPELEAKVEEISKRYRGALMHHLADDLIAIGLPADQAGSIAIGEVMASAARTAMCIALILHKREPRRELWLQRAGEHFDDARQWIETIPRDRTDEVSK